MSEHALHHASRSMLRSLLSSLALLLVLPACSSTDYASLASYYQHEPKTILVLPVRNESTDAEAPRFFLATIARPLVARGYYVIPLESTMEVLGSEGLYDASIAWQADPGALAQYLGADAVLYVTITSWDTTYVVLASSVTVGLHYRLVDCRTGQVIWENAASYTRSSDAHAGGGGIAGLAASLIVMAVDAAATAAFTEYVALAREANASGLATLPPGHYHESYADLQAAIDEWEAKQAANEG